MSNAKISTKGIVVWSICVAFFLYEFLLRTIIGTYQVQIMKDLSLSSVQFSWLNIAFILIYGLMQLPVGFIVNSIGLKKSLCLGAICCVVSNVCFSYASSYYFALFSRALMGLGASFGFICLLYAIHDWMPKKYSAACVGISQFIGAMGPICAAGPIATLDTIDWRLIFMILCGAGCCLLFLIIMLVDSNYEKAGQYTIVRQKSDMRGLFRNLISSAQPYYIAFMSSGLYCSVEYFAENDGVSFLVSKGFDSMHGAYIISVSWAGYAIGCPLFGILSDVLKRRKIVMGIASLMGFFALLTILYSANGLCIQIAFFVLGVSAGCQSICYANIIEHFNNRFAVVGFAINNAAIMIACVVNMFIISALLDSGAGDKSVTGYIFALTPLVVTSALVVCVAFFCLKETYCANCKEFLIINK